MIVWSGCFGASGEEIHGVNCVDVAQDTCSPQGSQKAETGGAVPSRPCRQ
jgi:hypothetical protein